MSKHGTSGYMTDDEINTAFDKVHPSEKEGENIMQDFQEITSEIVWSRLQQGKTILAVILLSDTFREGIYDLTIGWHVNEINSLLANEKNVILFEKIEKEEN